jgi:hypothetical protein
MENGKPVIPTDERTTVAAQLKLDVPHWERGIGWALTKEVL